MLRVGQRLHQLGSPQSGVGEVVQLEDPPLTQPGLVTGDDLRNGNGVQETETAQQPLGSQAASRQVAS
ncbi:hypothetical protein SVIO_109650 [Streptomyces violaceusniger]|uniref:Uncharacterized protein n=1 Tax=Streptomyces violaceusniger TaxID=68280 RepID=A0A4D4LGB6_STRVO|nr:hypothetical protein SVIO_109650 [Streptomyces violaceusniger]